MNAKQFLILLNQGNSLQTDDFRTLVRLHETFPYFAIPKILAAKFEIRKTMGESMELLHWASIQSPDRVRLKQLIEQDIDFLPPPSDISEPLGRKGEIFEIKKAELSNPLLLGGQDPLYILNNREEILKKLEDSLNRIKNLSEKNTEEHQEPSPSPTDPLLEKKRESEDLIETIKKKEKKEILDVRKKEQNDLIKAFSKKSIKLAISRENEDESKLADLSKKSTLFNDNLISESFAKLLVKQNKKDKAIEIYQKLILKFPNKTTYFASLIKELED